MNYEQVYNKIVQDLEDYVRKYNLKSLVLGISGGIDSTVCAAICREVCDRVGIPLIGRSLPIKNKEDEFDVSKLVGETFCNDFKVVPLSTPYSFMLDKIIRLEEWDDNTECSNESALYTKNSSEIQTPIANGNIQARLRMIYLYNLASIHNGIVIDTDNLTENNLGFFTIHGDQGDYKPIIGLWKTEVYELARWYKENYVLKCIEETTKLRKQGKLIKAGLIEDDMIWKALEQSLSLTPTDGLGISNSDLEQIGAKSYADVDTILQTLLPYGNKTIGMICSTEEEGPKVCHGLITAYGSVVDKVWNRHLNSQFKRNFMPGTYRAIED